MKYLSLNKILGGTCAVLVVSIFLTACGRKVVPEESCNFVQNSQLQRVSWGDRVPIKLYVHQDVPEELHDSIQKAVDEWNWVLKRDVLTVVFGTSGQPVPKRDGYSVIYWISDTWESDRFSEQARTTVYWSGSQIYEADVRINAYNFEFFESAAEPDKERVHFQSLVLHELGHVLGLAHSDHEDSVMNVILHDGQIRDKAKDFDRNSLRCEY